MYIIQVKKSDIEEMKEELTNLKSLESFEGECDEDNKKFFSGKWIDGKKFDFLAFNKDSDINIIKSSEKIKKIEVPEFYKEEYWWYLIDVPNEDMEYDEDTGEAFVSDQRWDYEDFDDDVEILAEKYFPRSVDWKKVLEYMDEQRFI